MKTPQELIQFIRSLTTAQITVELEKVHRDDPDGYIVIEAFFTRAKENRR